MVAGGKGRRRLNFFGLKHTPLMLMLLQRPPGVHFTCLGYSNCYRSPPNKPGLKARGFVKIAWHPTCVEWSVCCIYGSDLKTVMVSDHQMVDSAVRHRLEENMTCPPFSSVFIDSSCEPMPLAKWRWNLTHANFRQTCNLQTCNLQTWKPSCPQQTMDAQQAMRWPWLP